MSLLNQIYEVKSDIDSIVKRIAKATDENYHTKSLKILVSEVLKDKKWTKALEGMEMISDYFGHSPSQLIELRNFMLDEALKKVKKMVTLEEYEKINGAF